MPRHLGRPAHGGPGPSACPTRRRPGVRSARGPRTGRPRASFGFDRTRRGRLRTTRSAGGPRTRTCRAGSAVRPPSRRPPPGWSLFPDRSGPSPGHAPLVSLPVHLVRHSSTAWFEEYRMTGANATPSFSGGAGPVPWSLRPRRPAPPRPGRRPPDRRASRRPGPDRGPPGRPGHRGSKALRLAARRPGLPGPAGLSPRTAAGHGPGPTGPALNGGSGIRGGADIPGTSVGAGSARDRRPSAPGWMLRGRAGRGPDGRPGPGRRRSSGGARHRARTGRTTRRTLVSRAGTAAPKASEATAAAVYGPTPGSRRRSSSSSGTAPPWSATMRRAASERATALRL